MTELLNTYTKHHDEYIELLVHYYPLHEKFLSRQSPYNTAELRKQLKKMRKALQNMEKAAQERMHERRIEWCAVNRVKKEKEE